VTVAPAQRNHDMFRSMTEPRPFYHEFAWAYDLLVGEPIEARVAAIIPLLSARGVRPPNIVLDAGCGTGRYACALASNGFHVVGVDRAPELIKVAQARSHPIGGSIDLFVGDLTSVTSSRQFNAIFCRGVLNDVLSDADREQIARRLAELAAPGGILILDVRDWLKTIERCRVRPSTKRKIDLPGGSKLAFRSETTLETSTQQMIVRETFEFSATGSTSMEHYATEFRMRCWSSAALQERFAPCFEDIEILPDYVTPPAWADRLVLVGKRRGG
jgi:SAM-dependent methyltransferase